VESHKVVPHGTVNVSESCTSLLAEMKLCYSTDSNYRGGRNAKAREEDDI
jgi:hypothetical protein